MCVCVRCFADLVFGTVLTPFTFLFLFLFMFLLIGIPSGQVVGGQDRASDRDGGGDGMLNDDDLDAEADDLLNFVGGLDGDGDGEG